VPRAGPGAELTGADAALVVEVRVAALIAGDDVFGVTGVTAAADVAVGAGTRRATAGVVLAVVAAQTIVVVFAGLHHRGDALVGAAVAVVVQAIADFGARRDFAHALTPAAVTGALFARGARHGRAHLGAAVADAHV